MLDGCSECYRFESEFEFLCLNPRQCQQVLDELVQSGSVAVDYGDELARCIGVTEGAVLQGFCRSTHGCDRRAQLVRDVGDEVPAYRLEAPKVGDIEENGDCAGCAFQRCNVCEHPAWP